jgi:hypothetical protein
VVENSGVEEVDLQISVLIFIERERHAELVVERGEFTSLSKSAACSGSKEKVTALLVTVTLFSFEERQIYILSCNLRRY